MIYELWLWSVCHPCYRNNRRHIFPEFYFWEFFRRWLHAPYLTNLPDCLNIFYEILHYVWLILFNKIAWRVLRIQVGLVCFLFNIIQNFNIIQKYFSWWSSLICSLPDIYGAADNNAPLGWVSNQSWHLVLAANVKKQDKSRLGSMIVVRSFSNILLVIVRFSKGGLDNYFNDKNLLKMQSCIFYLIHASIK